jgi:cobalt-zinc-cadmium efflux system outer membrane protein
MWGSGAAHFESVEGDLESVLDKVPSLAVVRARLPMNPLMARREVERQRQRAVVSSERAARTPDLAVAVGFQRFEEDDTDSLMFAVGVPLPLFDRNLGNIAAAQHELAKVEVERRAAELSLSAAAMAAHAKLISSHKRVDALRTRVVPAMEEAFEAAHTGYQQGKYGFLDMLDAQRGLFETRGALVAALSDYHSSVADLERITGTTIEQLLNETEESVP